MKIDLHSHSTASDGKLSPEGLIDLAIKQGVKILALTDHDSVSGLERAIEYCKDKPIEFIPGIEFSANPGDLAKELHVLGLFIDSKNKEIKELIEKQKEFKLEHTKKLIKRLNQLGYDLNFEEVSKDSNKSLFGRPTLARALMKKYPEFKSIAQVFTELLGSEGKAFCKNESTLIQKIIQVIHKAGGLAILAHPGYIEHEVDKVVKGFIKFGGDGLEVDYPYVLLKEEAPKLRAKFRKIAEENNLLISGGTDFHEENKDFNLGDFGLTEKEFKKMKAGLKS